MSISIKQAKYVKAILDGKTQEQAGLEAGSKTIEGARKLATRMSKDVQVQKALEGAQELSLTQAGITRAKALKPISEALEANKVASIAGDFFQTEIPDYPIRLKAADMALKLLGQKDEDKPFDLANLDLENMDELELTKAVLRRTKQVSDS